MYNHNEKSKDGFQSYANSFQAVTVPGLSRIQLLCDKLGNPEQKLRFIHVAGTNGKGSVVSFLSSVLQQAGYRTGKYMSPNLLRVNERISVDGGMISDEELAECLSEIEPCAQEVEKESGIPPTQFEIWTMVAFLYFYRKACDYVVLEVGLGGELDATNVIPQNEIAVITRLGLDHTEYLGNSIEEVAAAKAGIMKSASRTKTLVTVPEAENVMRVIEEKAKETGISVKTVHAEGCGIRGLSEAFRVTEIPSSPTFVSGLSGVHQIENAACAAYAAYLLGVPLPCIEEGILHTVHPARFEIIQQNPTVIYDGAHNPNGVEALLCSLERYFPNTEKNIIFACMRDKEILPSLQMLNRGKTHFYFTEVKDNPRAMSAEALSEKAKEAGIYGGAYPEIGDAFRLATATGRLTVICGSLYLYKDFMSFYTK